MHVYIHTFLFSLRLKWGVYHGKDIVMMLSVAHMLNVIGSAEPHYQVVMLDWLGGGLAGVAGEQNGLPRSNTSQLYDDRITWDCVAAYGNKTVSGASSDEEANSEMNTAAVQTNNKKW